MRITRSIALGASAVVGLSLALTGCAGSTGSAGGDASADPVKMCVLVSDATSSEALGFKDYYTEYVQENFPVEFVYSDELADADAEKSAMENFIANNCKAVISFASADRPAQIEMAEDAGVYYAVATGTLSDEDYETYKDYEYYVGAIGPSLDIEFQAGYDMAQFFVEEGDTSFGLFGAGIPYYLDMHIHRTAGILAALAEEPSTTYGGQKDPGAILGKIYQDGTIKIADFESDVYSLTGYLEAWNFSDSAWQANMAGMVAAQPDAILAAGTGFAVVGAAVAGTDIKIGDIDAYTEDNKAAMESGALAYLAGKFTSINGPIFAATLSAVQGEPLRADGDAAIALGQGYWVATSIEEFDQILAADSVESPVYDKTALEPWIASGATYDDFATFVSQYTYADLVG
ncbi:sugar ABC transporter substrate-binding protein [Microbacterium hominis]|uniref:Sugar ABC transporter substrate-binding protein n=1 Tax=Microbacterium hominis TaxID=162426 RepID=A0A7D4QL42_9MICO|nr:sugar ABC transporter substrate-binding protein [Microbacterium hominis]QKJ20796.1 sugar ABC transporter substrate-binding protein [Microbacterium hominis]